MEHTSREWIYAGNTTINRADPIFYHANVICGGKRVARVAGIGEDEAMAYAHLIAAAPDLLDACKAAHEAATIKLGTYSDTEKAHNDIIWQLKEAIAKAEGVTL